MLLDKAKLLEGTLLIPTSGTDIFVNNLFILINDFNNKFKHDLINFIKNQHKTS